MQDANNKRYQIPTERVQVCMFVVNKSCVYSLKKNNKASVAYLNILTHTQINMMTGHKSTTH